MAVRPSDSRRRITRWAIIWAIPLILAAAPTAAKQYPDDLIWSRAPRPILQSSREYLLHGESVNGLCQYSYPDVQLPSAAATWEVDDIAISAGSCTKVVLEGKPEVTATSSAQDATVAAIERSSRYQQQLWYEDVLGITVTWSQTKVQWWWDGACALGGNTYRYYDMFEQSGWYYVSGNKSASSSCTAYTGNSWVTFRNSLFCSAQPGWTAPVDVYVTRNQIAGRDNGTVALSYAMTYSPSCAGFFLHRSYGPY
jgi:hypothetical protein